VVHLTQLEIFGSGTVSTPDTSLVCTQYNTTIWSGVYDQVPLLIS